MLPQPPQLSKFFNCYTLVAVCMIGLIYHFHLVQDHLAARIPEVPTTIPRNPNGIPKLLWYKLGPKGLSEEARNWTDTCIKGNPEYRPYFMTDESGDRYVRKTFAFRPDIVSTYLAFPIPIYKADMLRYLLLWDKGGVWSDLDVSCEGVPMDEWVPPEYQGKASLVVGWEFDAGHDEPYMRQFCSWTFMAKPRLPHMMQVIDDILEEVRAKTLKYSVPVENITLEMMGDVVDFTGPRRLTTGTFRSLAKRLNRTIDITETYNILEPQLFEDVLILPAHSFSALTNRYTSEEELVLPPQLVTHHYSGSWKNDKGGESKRRR